MYSCTSAVGVGGGYHGRGLGLVDKYVGAPGWLPHHRVLILAREAPPTQSCRHSLRVASLRAEESQVPKEHHGNSVQTPRKECLGWRGGCKCCVPVNSPHLQPWSPQHGCLSKTRTSTTPNTGGEVSQGEVSCLNKEPQASKGC